MFAVRFVVSSTEPGGGGFYCELGILDAGPDPRAAGPIPSIFEFRRRAFEDVEKFRVVLLVPTGINATIGGHAGDAGPVARPLAVATCWRLEVVDTSLDRLTDRARMTFGRRNRAAPARCGGRVASWRALHHDGHALILDLADFEGPLTDPARFVPSLEAARLYRRLCGRLGLYTWRDRIDERAEVLEGILEILSASRDHRQVITLQIALEVLIIVLLATDVAASLLSCAWE